MGGKIKVTVSTGWAGCDHVDYFDIPEYWDEMADDEKEKYLDECATEYLHERCEASVEVVNEDD